MKDIRIRFNGTARIVWALTRLLAESKEVN